MFPDPIGYFDAIQPTPIAQQRFEYRTECRQILFEDLVQHPPHINMGSPPFGSQLLGFDEVGGIQDIEGQVGATIMFFRHSDSFGCNIHGENSWIMLRQKNRLRAGTTTQVDDRPVGGK
jgi:hypothetical protein